MYLLESKWFWYSNLKTDIKWKQTIQKFILCRKVNSSMFCYLLGPNQILYLFLFIYLQDLFNLKTFWRLKCKIDLVNFLYLQLFIYSYNIMLQQDFKKSFDCVQNKLCFFCFLTFGEPLKCQPYEMIKYTQTSAVADELFECV